MLVVSRWKQEGGCQGSWTGNKESESPMMDGDSLCKQQDKYEAHFGLRDVRPFEPLRGCNDFSVSFFLKNK